ncbi:hypothetical protein R1sor_027592 [Riccia sorocarpa]|uniref:Uncharacterized protein n=1 Tax=Riccia sorocarpa TaxID=122646 RepID=A0ABD3GKC4_9MARC
MFRLYEHAAKKWRSLLDEKKAARAAGTPWKSSESASDDLAIATRLAAKYGPVSVQYQNAERRVEIRREKNVMMTNPFGHQGFAGFRARFKKAFGMYPLPKHTAFARAHGIKRVFQFMENGRDIPESDEAGPSNAEAGEDCAADDDFAAAAAVGAAAGAGTGDGVDDDALSDFSEGLRGAELEEDELGLSPQQEQHAESGGDDEDDTVYILLIHIYLYVF